LMLSMRLRHANENVPDEMSMFTDV
jgi:hypothetical protein